MQRNWNVRSGAKRTRARCARAGWRVVLLYGLLAQLSPSLGQAALERTAQLGPVTAHISLSPEEPVIGDRIQLRIEATAEDGVEVLMPAFGEALGRFTIQDFVPRESLAEDGRSVYSQRYSLQVPRSGEHTLPSLLIEFIDRRPGQSPTPEDRDAYEILTKPIRFEVASVVPDSASADLSPPLGHLDPFGTNGRTPYVALAAVLILLLAASPFAYRAWLKWREQVDQRSAYEIARAELDALLAGGDPNPDRPEKIDAFFVNLSSIVRNYLERRFQLRSPELTTERFLESVSASPDLTDAHQSLLQRFLRQCDLVKFAHHVPTKEDIREAISTASEFLDDTRGERPEMGDVEAST
jgi:hypothetical protein